MMIETMTGNIGKTEFAQMFAQAAACIRSEHQRLTELDSIGGDGDHGTTMLRAAEPRVTRASRIFSRPPAGECSVSMEARPAGFSGHSSPGWEISSLVRAR
jgi:hypothetical protein